MSHTSVLHPETEAILQEASRISQKGIQTYADPELTAHASVRLAKHAEPLHYIRYRPDQQDVRDYLIAHECGHIIRVFSTAPEQRKIATIPSNFRRFLYDNSDIRQYMLPDSLMADLESAMASAYKHYDSIIGLLTDGPADVHIEQWIHDNYSTLREIQKRTLPQQAALTYVSLVNRLHQATRKMHRTEATLVYALSRKLGRIIENLEIAEQFRELADEQNAEYMQRALAEVGDRGHIGDVDTTNRWARYLGLENWFEWSEWKSGN